MFNYPLERPWRESLAIFAEHWSDRGLKFTPRTLDAIGQLIAAELDEIEGVELAEASPSVPAEFSTATDAILPLAHPTGQSSTTASGSAESEVSGYEFAARRLCRSEKLRLSLTDEERQAFEAFIVKSLHAQAKGEPSVLPPAFWYKRNEAWLDTQAKQPEVRGITTEEQRQSELRWKYAHIDELPLEEQEKLRLQALIEERRRFAEKYGLLAAFLNPAFDGTGTLNDWAMVVGGFVSSPPPGLDFRGPRTSPPAMPQRGRRSGSAGRSRSAGARPIGHGRQRPGRKPSFPPPVSAQRVTIRKGRRTPDPRHVVGAAAEEKAARFIHTLPHEAVILWGEKIGAHGADIVSCNLKTRTVTLWDVKWRGQPVRLRPSKTLENNSTRLVNALDQAAKAVQASKLPEHHKNAAKRSIANKSFQTRTLGDGQAKNSTFGENQ